MLYRAFRGVVRLLLSLFYRIEVQGDLAPEGPVIFVGNHPNGLVDPGLVFALVQRRITFLAKAPLFRIPLVAQMLKVVGALPVYRRQDDPTQVGRNEGTMAAASAALESGGAITLFPEGKSHSEPQLAELKTGCARIALAAAKRGARVRIVPIGFVYEQKQLYRSRVRIDVGPPLDVAPYLERAKTDEPGAVRELTEQIATELRRLTLNLDRWEDLPAVETAEALSALRAGTEARDLERLRAFAAGMQLLRDEQPERFDRLRDRVMSFRRRLDLLRVRPEHLKVEYRPDVVARFVAKNLFALLLGLPLFVLGMALFVLPYQIPWLAAAVFRVERDVEATVKLLVLLVLAPLWNALLAAVAWGAFGPVGGVAALIGCLPLALFTRYFYERRAAAIADAATFFRLTRRATLKARLLEEGEALAREIEAVAEELRPRVAPPVDGLPTPPGG